MEIMATEQRPQRVNALGAFIAQRLSELGMTRAEFAERVAMARSSLYRLLGPEAPERLDSVRLHRIADVLQVDRAAIDALWAGGRGAVWTVEATDARGSLHRAFVLATDHLSEQELRAAIDIALGAVRMIDQRTGREASPEPRPGSQSDAERPARRATGRRAGR